MGKGGGSQTSTTTYTMSPEHRKILEGAMGRYMPDGQLPDSTPAFDFDNNPALQARGEHFVEGFSGDTQDAFQATRNRFGQTAGTIQEAQDYTRAGGQGAGMFQGAPDGWSVGDDGVARYQSFEEGVQKYMNPYTRDVVDAAQNDLAYARDRLGVNIDNDTVGRDSFGGTRSAVRQAVGDRGYYDAVGRTTAGLRKEGFDSAVGQYNRGFDQGQTALNYNTGIEQADRAAQLAAGRQLSDQATQEQGAWGNDINALGTIGGMQEDRGQRVRDASRANQMEDENRGLEIAQSLIGMAPPPSSTTNTKTKSGGSIWGTVGSAAAQMAASMMSDERAKKGVEDADPEDALAQIRKLIPKSFEYTPLAQGVGAPGGRRTGFMAQDLEKATGKTAPTGPGGFKGVDVHEHIGRLTQAVQALDAQMQERYKHRKAA